MEAGLPTLGSLVYLVNCVWVTRGQLTASSSGRLFLNADLDLYPLRIACFGLSVRVMNI